MDKNQPIEPERPAVSGAVTGSVNPGQEPPVERTSDAVRSGAGGFYLDLGRLIRSLPPDVNKKLSLHDLKRVCDNYNTIPCPNCYGGHFRPCQWCGDTGRVVFIPGGAERWANGDAGESESGAGSQNSVLPKQ